MKLLFSSFGLGTEGYEALFDNYFYRMCAISMGTMGANFVPDYPILFLFDSFVVDERTMSRVRNKAYSPFHQDLAAVLEALHSVGRLEIVDYEEAIRPYLGQIDATVENDIRSLEVWLPELEELARRWQAFTEIGKDALLGRKRDIGSLTADEEKLLGMFIRMKFGMFPVDENVLQTIRNWRKRLKRHQRDYARFVVTQYLSYITCNICLSTTLGASVHEWSDLEPLLLKKSYLCMQTPCDSSSARTEVQSLFELLFPDFSPKSAKALASCLDDQRVEQLRDLVRRSVSGKVEFDSEFALSVFREVLQVERKVATVRRITGYLTLPLGVVPGGTALQKGAEEARGYFTDSKLRKDQGWFYLISELDRG